MGSMGVVDKMHLCSMSQPITVRKGILHIPEKRKLKVHGTFSFLPLLAVGTGFPWLYDCTLPSPF